MASKFSTHRVLQLSELAYSARCAASSCTNAAVNAMSIGNRAATSAFIKRASRMNLISIRAAQLLQAHA